eukprot:SAG31_NODE_2262_length_6062_cov_12.422774_5_plen_463_part_00
MLLEKAYAKLHRTYENLKTGFVDYALKDLTGGNTQQLRWDNVALTEAEDFAMKVDKKWTLLRQLFSDGCLVGGSCSGKARPLDPDGYTADPDSYGLLKGHAYGILDCRELSSNSVTARLVRIRNPWGFREWGGNWSDNADEWQQDMGDGQTALAALNSTLPQDAPYTFGDDGTFWMDIEDFSKQFNTLYILRDLPEGQGWAGLSVDGVWVRGDTAGGSPANGTFMQNPQYHFSVAESTEVLILLEQPDMRMKFRGGSGSMFPTPIGLSIVKVPPEETDGELAAMSAKQLQKSLVCRSEKWQKQRDTAIECTLLPSGDARQARYAIIPSTFQPNQESEFRLHLWAKPPIKVDGLQQYAGGYSRPIVDLGEEDVGWDLGRPEVDDFEAEDESKMEQKAASDALQDVSNQLNNLRQTVSEQRAILDEQRQLIDKLSSLLAVGSLSVAKVGLKSFNMLHIHLLTAV